MYPRKALAVEPGTPMIVARDLAKTYPGGVQAVKGISFDVHAGEAFGVLGPNGAGKSTTIGMLTTAILPSAGSAYLAGIDVVARPVAARAVSSVVFQDAVVDKARRFQQAGGQRSRDQRRVASARPATHNRSTMREI